MGMGGNNLQGKLQVNINGNVCLENYIRKIPKFSYCEYSKYLIL